MPGSLTRVELVVAGHDGEGPGRARVGVEQAALRGPRRGTSTAGRRSLPTTSRRSPESTTSRSAGSGATLRPHGHLDRAAVAADDRETQLLPAARRSLGRSAAMGSGCGERQATRQVSWSTRVTRQVATVGGCGWWRWRQPVRAGGHRRERHREGRDDGSSRQHPNASRESFLEHEQIRPGRQRASQHRRAHRPIGCPTSELGPSHAERRCRRRPAWCLPLST